MVGSRVLHGGVRRGKWREGDVMLEITEGGREGDIEKDQGDGGK